MIEIKLSKLLIEVKNKLPSNDVNIILEFIEHNEVGLAFETLCTQLYEYNVQISIEIYRELSFCGKSMKIEPDMWLSLKKLIKI